MIKTIKQHSDYFADLLVCPSRINFGVITSDENDTLLEIVNCISNETISCFPAQKAHFQGGGLWKWLDNKHVIYSIKNELFVGEIFSGKTTSIQLEMGQSENLFSINVVDDNNILLATDDEKCHRVYSLNLTTKILKLSIETDWIRGVTVASDKSCYLFTTWELGSMPFFNSNYVVVNLGTNTELRIKNEDQIVHQFEFSNKNENLARFVADFDNGKNLDRLRMLFEITKDSKDTWWKFFDQTLDAFRNAKQTSNPNLGDVSPDNWGDGMRTFSESLYSQYKKGKTRLSNGNSFTGVVTSISGDYMTFSTPEKRSSIAKVDDQIMTNTKVWHIQKEVPCLQFNNSDDAPTVVSVHGGPSGISSTRYNSTRKFWLDQGYEIWEPNYRGSSGYGRKWHQAILQNYGIVDVADVTRTIKDLLQAKPNQKFILDGGSSAGLTVLMLLFTLPEHILQKCQLAVIDYPVLDMEQLTDPTSTWRFEQKYIYNLSTEDNFKTYSPFYKIDEMPKSLKLPKLLITHGEDDPVVPIATTDEFIKKINKRFSKVDLTYLRFAKEGHGYTRPETQDKITEVLIKLLKP
jgi:acetyl esterase/lipase